MSEPPCTEAELTNVLKEIIKQTKDALKELTMKSTLKKAEEKLKLESGDLNSWHRQWADDVLVKVLSDMLEQDPSIADTLDKPEPKAARKPGAKKAEKADKPARKPAKEKAEKVKEEPKEKAKKDEKVKKEEKAKKEDKKDNKKDDKKEKKEEKTKKLSGYHVYMKEKAKDKTLKAWGVMDAGEKDKFTKMAAELNGKEEKKEEAPAKEEKKETKKRKEKEDGEEPAAKKAKTTPKKPRKPRAKKAVEFFIADNKQMAMDGLSLTTYNMPKCQAFLRKAYSELSEKDKKKWVSMEAEDVKRVEKEAAEAEKKQ
eukprot:TRINITY_DN7949_c1_g1_i1.p1 TRINITY_DN7949_c1_g1~~TRINITY_DN7949_c1_g1_i1.p1  ORF type:complete len:328 (+),score=168.20 TRINITY_DN7949_c1_g1_i1:47-985(+)